MQLASHRTKYSRRYVENMYNSMAKELLGYEKRQKTMPWISKEVLELSDKRKEMKATRYKDEECGKNYKR